MAASLAIFFKKISWVYIENKLESGCQVESKSNLLFLLLIDWHALQIWLALVLFLLLLQVLLSCKLSLVSTCIFNSNFGLSTWSQKVYARFYVRVMLNVLLWGRLYKKINPTSNLPSFSSGLWIFTERGKSHSLEMHALLSYIDEDLVKLAESIK